MKKLLYILFLLLTIGLTSACQNTTTLRVGMDLRWAPFETIDSLGKPTGISVDLAYELGTFLNREVEIVNLEFGSLITALETNQIDVIIGSMTITAERAQKINFSDPYFYFPLITVMNKSFYESNTFETKEELFAIPGVRYVGPKTFISLSIPREEALNPIILEVNDANAAVLEVISGSADAFIISASSAVNYANANPDTTVIFWDPIDYSPIGMGVAKGNDALLASINAFIASLFTDGVYDRLGVKYNDIIAQGLPGQTIYFYTKVEDENE
jgi:polar amino acid transport system substrate-binding protein